MTAEKLDPRSPEAMEAERRELEQAKIHQPRPQAKQAAHKNQAHSERFVTPKDALAALKATMRKTPSGPERLYRCGVCQDTGWTEIDEKGRGTWARCRRGCEVPVKNITKRRSQGSDDGPVSIS